jgi:peptidyl-prolyl cis-trans isomerase A (cyclophilin A)
MQITRTLGLFLLPVLAMCQDVTGPYVHFNTNLGVIDVQLFPDAAPQTVANFLRYVNKGAYNNSVFHRSVSKFIIQGGGYSKDLKEIAADAPVVNEYKISNTRGTIAMAKVDGDPNSATNQWFFNLGNNSANLDSQNGGFTVFGRVVSTAGLAVMDKIGALPNSAVLAAPFDQIPLQNYSSGSVQESNLIIVTSITQMDTPQAPAISENGVITAGGFGGFQSAAPGSFIEIYGSNLAGEVSRGWETRDFVANNAPTTLEGVSVTVDGRATFVNYVSPTQVNVQLPAGVRPGGTVPVVVTSNGQASAPAMIAIKTQSAGILAPASFKVGDKQFVVATHGAGGAFVSSTAPAVPGETLVFYGIGFGVVNPASTAIAGRVINGPNTLASPVQFKFGGRTGQVAFAGLVQGLVGVYQFNVVVPSDVAAGDVPLEVMLNNESLSQSLYIPVQMR